MADFLNLILSYTTLGNLVILKENFDHIKSGGPCPVTDEAITEGQQLFESRFHINQDNVSLLLARILDDCHGTEEIVYIRRKAISVEESIINADCFQLRTEFRGGSNRDGLKMPYSDYDCMIIQNAVFVTYPDQVHLLPQSNTYETVLLMRTTGCRPGYVNLQLYQIIGGHGIQHEFQNAIVPKGTSLFLSSDLYRQGYVDLMTANIPVMFFSNGPCLTEEHHGHSHDYAYAFTCSCWPREASEWIHRTRLHGWPTQAMVQRIVEGGCHLVPVGDKCSSDTLLQWRISFVCAEQLLIHSLTHPQFRVYGLLKYFLFQIKELLEHIIGDDDILCSYFIKTVIFYAVENSPRSLWQEKNTFICFRFCFAILIAWVRSGYCPNYFIRQNNMFLRKVHGEARRKLLHFLTDLYNLKLMCLSVQSDRMDIGIRIQHRLLSSKMQSEFERDVTLFFKMDHRFSNVTSKSYYKSLRCLHVAHTDIDVFIAYHAMVHVQHHIAFGLLNEYKKVRGNKQNYIVLRRCSSLLIAVNPVSELLLLASFYYLAGNYCKTLRLCSEVMSTARLFIGAFDAISDLDKSYERLYCGKGYSLWHKFKEGVYFPVIFYESNITLCPPHLHLEVTNYLEVFIPPVPYAMFLSFLCYHELGDFRRRDTELMNLRAVNYHPCQGGHKYWIVNTLLGVCYQTVGDIGKAIWSFRGSLSIRPDGNPAKERIEALRSSR